MNTTTQTVSILNNLCNEAHAAMEASWETADRLYGVGREVDADWAQAQGEIFQARFCALVERVRSMKAARRILRERL